MSVVVVLTTIPAVRAKTLAQTLVKARAAACVNIVPKMTSIYGYEEKIHEEEEALLIIKTATQNRVALCALIDAEHPYDVPEILCFESEHASEAYERFVRDWVKP